MNLRRFYPSLLKTPEYKRQQDRLCAAKHAGQREWGGRAGKLPRWSTAASQTEWPQYGPAGWPVLPWNGSLAHLPAWWCAAGSGQQSPVLAARPTRQVPSYTDSASIPQGRRVSLHVLL